MFESNLFIVNTLIYKIYVVKFVKTLALLK